MPNKCCIIGCRGNYTNKNDNKVENKVHIFKFPQDENLRKMWIDAIQRNHFVPSKWSSVCHKHFRKTDILFTEVAVDSETGQIVTAPLERPKLKVGAIPCMNLYQSKKFTEDKLGHDKEKQVPKTSPRQGPKKMPPSKQQSENTSSDDDIPLETLKNKNLQNVNNPVHLDTEDSEDRTLSEKFKNLIDKYEALKSRSVDLAQKIDVLMKANIKLKMELFK